MEITVKFHSLHAVVAGTRRDEMTASEPLTVKKLLELLLRKYPGLERLAESTIVSINRKLVHDDAMINDGDEVALLPLAGGG